MAILPVRSLGKFGIIHDVAPYDLPIGAWSGGYNVRFKDGRVSRAPIYRTVYTYDHTSVPALLQSTPLRSSAGDFDEVVAISEWGDLYGLKNGVVRQLAPAGWPWSQSSESWTTCTLAGLTYANRPGNVPVFYDGDDTFHLLSDFGWDSTWRCKSLRSFGDLLVAINVTKGSVEHPQMFKWSDFTESGLPPDSWDPTDTTKSAGENVLSNLSTPLVDGLALRDAFCVYSEAETTLVRLIGGRLVLDFRTLFNDVGLIARNCVVEANNLHYVMDQDDIVVHDGVSWKSIIDGRNRRWLFDNLVLPDKGYFFAFHDKRNSAVIFAVKSRAQGLKWRLADYCNLGAVYNYRDDNWSFIDLPNVTSACHANVNQSETWETTEGTWEQAGGTWEGQDDGLARHLTMTANVHAATGITAGHRLIAMDNVEVSSVLTMPSEAEVNSSAWVERVGMDLDDAGAEIRGYKLVTRIYPQLQLHAHPVEFRVGGSVVASSTVNYGDPKTLNPATGYKIDCKSGGRYLALRVDETELSDFSLTGLDLETKVIGRR